LEESPDNPGYMFFGVDLDVPNADEAEVYQSLNNLYFGINIKTFLVDYISVNTGTLDRYSIPKILAENGRPQQIYVHAVRHPVSYFNGISIDLYYPQYGFMSEHFTTVTDDEFNQESLLACFQKDSNLFLWSQEKNGVLSQESKLGTSDVFPFDLSKDKTIDQVSNYDVESFYQEFKGINSQFCMQFETIKLFH
jgi:hypothetical protein